MTDKVRISARMAYADVGRLREQCAALEEAGCDELHFDIADGTFVPDILLGFGAVEMAKQACSLPCHVHLLTQRPERFVDRCAGTGADVVSLHVEACVHAQRALAQVRGAGLESGVALNPATPLTKVDYLLDYVDRVLLVCAEPGYAASPFISTSFERVRVLRANLTHRKLSARLQVEGDLSLTHAAVLANMGATDMALDDPAILRSENVTKALADFRQGLAVERHLV